MQIQPVHMGALTMTGHPAWRPNMGQAVTANQTTPPTIMVPAPPKKEFIDSSLIAFLFDVAGATSSGILAYGASRRGNKMAWVFGAMTLVLGIKGIVDVSQTNK